MPDTQSYLSSLREELGAQLTPDRVTSWAAGDEPRSHFLDKQILGSIEWSRQLGRPDASSLADGFAITHEYFDQTLNQGPEGAVATGWRSGDSPVVWEDEDAQSYRVGFSCAMNQPGIANNKIEVAMAHIPWRDESPHIGGPRHVVPPSQQIAPPALRAVMNFQVLTPPPTSGESGIHIGSG